MREYSGKLPEAIGTPPQALASSSKAVPKFVSLPSKYKLHDHPIYPQCTATISTEEEDFEKYKNGLLSAQDTDLVSFWEVNSLCFTR